MNPGPKALRKLLRQLTAAPFQLKRLGRNDLSFESSGDRKSSLKDGKARVWLRPRIRVADELDLAPDLLIADAGLGVIGLVHVIEAPDKDLAVEANRDVDQATYLRDLLLAKGTVGGPEASPVDYTVETVLVIAQGLAPAITGVVRDILTKTRFLHATGLNLLSYSENGDFDPHDVRRAFAWLLLVTRERLLGCRCPASGGLQGLRLSNYRLPGQRNWTLDASRVHLLQGANGTGKSSMAEALELAVTGAVERIERDHPGADYDRIIRNSDSEAPAQVSVAFIGQPANFDFDVVKSGRISKPSLQPSLPVTAFRLDQTVMDELVRASSQQRARVLTRAFFPGPAYQGLEKAHDASVKAFHELPTEIQTEIQGGQPNSDEWPAILISRLDWVDNPSAPVVVADVLPLPRTHLDTLAAIAPEIKDCLSKIDRPMDRSTFESMLQVLDEALNRVRAKVRPYRDAVVESLAALARVGSWRPDSNQASMEYSHALREWAERIALSNVLQKSLDVTKTIAAARQSGWTGAPDKVAGLMSLPTDVAALTKATADCVKEQDEFLQQLQSGSPAGTTGASAVASVTSLTSTEIDYLNLTGEWWGRQQPTPPAEPCGAAIQKAISENKAIGLGPIMVGSEKWADQLIAFLMPINPALETLLAFDQPPSSMPDATPPRIYRSPVVRLNGFKTALACARTEDEAAKQVDETLKKRLLELSPALDEMVALFTPARWAYEGILVQAERRDGKAVVELMNSKTSGQADLRLNTAELNMIVLALYLLCGPTIDNPLSTIILDDPLQNMDELTAATVARGVAKFTALMPEGWQLIIMFHGDEDLETFSREVRGSVYRLPWLGPVGIAVSSPIIQEPLRRRPKEVRLSTIIQQSPQQQARRCRSPVLTVDPLDPLAIP